MNRRPTPRGWALLAAGVVATQLAVGLGSIDLLRLGVLLLAVPVTALLAEIALDALRGRRGLEVHRDVRPDPVHAGEDADVRVEIRATDRAGRARLASLRFSEQAAVELSGGRALRARVARRADHATVRYPVRATQRGRWPLGPLVITRTDTFGVVRSRTTLGSESQVAVWPAVVALPAPSDVLVGEPDRVALGARTPSTDDANLRDYREGDDLRRVHWRSSARRGTMLVRSDERAGMRPVTVLLDLPVRAATTEWTISLAASMALAMLETGHPVRLAAGDAAAVTAARVMHGAAPYVHARQGPESRAALLDQTLDLAPARTSTEAEGALLDAVRVLDTSQAAGELVLAVVGPLSPAGCAALTHLADVSQGWALVRTDGRHAGDARDARHTAGVLRRSGWRVAEVTTGEDLVECWLRLLGSAR
ncbi:protein of unknown function DUF58 [Cellulomonas flavigena DSM 20109]|uniref:DUF58 domain-containing protein n=1 Tax=Cellulomonas flavigena (strain ATCC 482 / DSM 20109 / BCRC 11376 / JCM 18109 / NBRC 3775 / NCIMB 8073 / NRS 134) TaxID=446466 RepID=D5UDS5_CELFN|nr:DUF58 domain-containing protein [Cellulomonas flavigena]ADG74483.1 protein of unknown function DUF58 [Cellulomonas flavigena DSM 20109]